MCKQAKLANIDIKVIGERFDEKNHICVSCDVVDYTPVSVEEIMENNNLLAMGINNENGLYSVGLKNFKDVKFEKGQKIGEDTENSTSGFTRNRIRIYMARSK